MDKDRERWKGIDNSVNILGSFRIVYCVHSIEISARQQWGL